MGKLFASSLVLVMVSTFGAAVARETVALRTNRVEIAYVAPKNAAHKHIYWLSVSEKYWNALGNI